MLFCLFITLSAALFNTEVLFCLFIYPTAPSLSRAVVKGRCQASLLGVVFDVRRSRQLSTTSKRAIVITCCAVK